PGVSSGFGNAGAGSSGFGNTGDNASGVGNTGDYVSGVFNSGLAAISGVLNAAPAGFTSGVSNLRDLLTGFFGN
ncbi:hypothetical protein, partial [Mycobacterium alsense]